MVNFICNVLAYLHMRHSGTRSHALTGYAYMVVSVGLLSLKLLGEWENTNQSKEFLLATTITQKLTKFGYGGLGQYSRHEMSYLISLIILSTLLFMLLMMMTYPISGLMNPLLSSSVWHPSVVLYR